MRDLINIIDEATSEIERTAAKAVINLTGSDSMVYTKLAQKVEHISQLEDEIKNLKEEVKAETRQYVADLFTAEDEARTRVVNTISFIFTLSKNPKATESVQYAKVLGELEAHLTPELITVLNSIKEKYTTMIQKSPSLRIEPQESISESVNGIISFFKKYLATITNWANAYDKKLVKLKSAI